MEALLSMMDLHAARYLVNDIVPKQVGNEHPTGVPTNTYKTSDGYVSLSIMPRMWPDLCRAIGREEAADDPRFDTREARRAHRRECNGMIADAMAGLTTEEILKRLAAADIPSGPAYTIETLRGCGHPVGAGLHHRPDLRRPPGPSPRPGPGA
jgi:crotonobetainyl-CoA:carnitine CoA-transferase CaiB-like acyl-CoA transferase